MKLHEARKKIFGQGGGPSYPWGGGPKIFWMGGQPLHGVWSPPIPTPKLGSPACITKVNDII